MCKDTDQRSLEEKVKISPRRYSEGLKHLLSVGKEELDARVKRDRQQRRKKRKAN
jgi:hypothetical protein